jgi:hypothetical protein
MSRKYLFPGHKEPITRAEWLAEGVEIDEKQSQPQGEKKKLPKLTRNRKGG